MQAKPNLLWIYLEDVSPWLPLWGDNTVETPNIDVLASRGEVFTKTFSTAPVCSPSRSANILGKMQTSVGVHNHCDSINERGSVGRHQVKLPHPIKTLPEIFRENGYFTFNKGKDDYNFSYDRGQVYSEENDWNAGNPRQPFFGQIQLLGGKNQRLPQGEVERESVPIPGCYPEHPVIREEIAKHYERIKVVDEEVGEIVGRLKKDGLYDNTIIVIVGDHGMRMLRHKQFLYDGGIHVVLMISTPGGHDSVKSGSKNEDLVSGIDLAPTCLALCGIDIPEWMEGNDLYAGSYTPRQHIIAARDRCDYTIDRIRCVRTSQYKYIRNFMPERPYLQSQYRDFNKHTEEFVEILKELYTEGKMPGGQDIFYSRNRPEEELYDIINDPDELNNLADDPACQQALVEMRKILDDWIKETDDKGQYPEPVEALMDVIDRGKSWDKHAVDPAFDFARKLIAEGK